MARKSWAPSCEKVRQSERSISRINRRGCHHAPVARVPRAPPAIALARMRRLCCLNQRRRWALGVIRNGRRHRRFLPDVGALCGLVCAAGRSVLPMSGRSGLPEHSWRAACSRSFSWAAMVLNNVSWLCILAAMTISSMIPPSLRSRPKIRSRLACSLPCCRMHAGEITPCPRSCSRQIVVRPQTPVYRWAPPPGCCPTRHEAASGSAIGCSRSTSSGLWDGRSDGQIFLGEAIDSAAGALGYTDDRHVCLVSGTRGGKGTGIIIPNLCLWPGSCVVVDPKGENATVTARRRGGGSEYCFGLGQTVRILDPFGEVQIDASLKARYNPLDAIDPASDFAVDDAGRVAAALVVVESRSDPYWEEAARDLIKGLILHVLTDPDFEGRRNLVSVWRLLNQGDWISLEMLRGAGEKDIPSGFDLLWQGMKRSAAYGGLVAGTGEQFAAMAERTRSSILGSARSSLEFISGPPMQRILEASDFDLAALKTDPRGLSLYLTLPQRYMSTHFRWLRLMVSLAVGEMERIKGPPATGYPTLFLLDEFAGLKRMEAIEHAAAQAAGFGVKFFFVVQNLTQLKEAYKDSWETFLGNSGVKLFFQIEDDFTRSYLTRQLGEQEVRRATRSGSQSQSSSRSFTEGKSLSSSLGTSSSSTKGKNVGRSVGRTRGGSRGSSLTYDGPLRIFSTSASTNKGRNWSNSNSSSVGWSTSVSDSQSRSQSSSTSSSRSTSRSESITEGWSEGVHKRSLLNPDEVGRLLARVDDRTDPAYPGVLIALTPGRDPLLARRVNYFESPGFAGLFDPHPDYPRPPTLSELATRATAQRALEEAQSKNSAKSHRWGILAIGFVTVIVGALCLRPVIQLVTMYHHSAQETVDHPVQEKTARAPQLVDHSRQAETARAPQSRTLRAIPTSRTLAPQASEVWTVAFSPDGRLLASGARAVIHLWDPTTGQLVRKMSVSPYRDKWDNGLVMPPVFTMAFSSDGQLLASGDGYNMIKLWNVANGRAEGILSGHTKYSHGAGVLARDENACIDQYG